MCAKHNYKQMEQHKEKFIQYVTELLCKGEEKQQISKIIAQSKYDRIKNYLEDKEYDYTDKLSGARKNAKFRFWVRSKGFLLRQLGETSEVFAIARGKVVRVIPAESSFEIIAEIHEEYGHDNSKRPTWRKILANYYGITRDFVDKFVEFCPLCVEFKSFPCPDKQMRRLAFREIKKEKVESTEKAPKPKYLMKLLHAEQMVLTFTMKRDSYERWTQIGAAQGLSSETDIANFLIKYYENSSDKERQNTACISCKTPLNITLNVSLRCNKCEVTSSATAPPNGISRDIVSHVFNKAATSPLGAVLSNTICSFSGTSTVYRTQANANIASMKKALIPGNLVSAKRSVMPIKSSQIANRSAPKTFTNIMINHPSLSMVRKNPKQFITHTRSSLPKQSVLPAVRSLPVTSVQTAIPSSDVSDTKNTDVSLNIPKPVVIGKASKLPRLGYCQILTENSPVRDNISKNQKTPECGTQEQVQNHLGCVTEKVNSNQLQFIRVKTPADIQRNYCFSIITGQSQQMQKTDPSNLGRTEGEIIGTNELIKSNQSEKDSQGQYRITIPALGVPLDTDNINPKHETSPLEHMWEVKGRFLVDDEAEIIVVKPEPKETMSPYPPAIPSAQVKHNLLHSGEHQYNCDSAPKRFVSNAIMTDHKYTHTKPSLATYCSGVTNHKHCHLGLKRSVCHHCGKAFYNAANLRQHMNIHAGVRPYICHTCGQSFVWKLNWKKHMDTHSSRVYRCDKCRKVFTQACYLSRHKKMHAYVKLFRLDYPNRSSHALHHFKSHTRIHSAGKCLYNCQFCSMYFCKQSMLKKHLQRVHSGKCSYSCGHCGKVHAGSGTLHRHEQMHMSH